VVSDLIKMTQENPQKEKRWRQHRVRGGNSKSKVGGGRGIKRDFARKGRLVAISGERTCRKKKGFRSVY